jgi:hypothetical protein
MGRPSRPPHALRPSPARRSPVARGGLQLRGSMSGKGKGKGKAPDSGVKSRNISSFFAKAPPPTPAPRDAADVDDAATPAKRARLDPANGASPLPADGGEVEDAATPMEVAPRAAPPSQPAQPLPPLQIPASDAARHAHFAEKLSLGPPRRNGAARDVLAGVPLSEYGRDAGPAGPYTPLERQIVALKRAHPGVLLMVEVRDCARLAAGKPPRLVKRMPCRAAR